MRFRSLSLLVPTRGQVPRLANMWESFVQTVGDTPVDVVFRIDDDDAETADWLRATATTVEAMPAAQRRRWFTTPAPTFRRTVIVGPRRAGYLSLPTFFNEMAAHAQGDLFMCGNDDMTFLTPGWPAKFLQVANRYPDGVFDIGCYSYPAGSFPFSVVSRTACQRMGLLNDPRLLYSDIFLRDVMSQLGRAVFEPSVQILHVGVADKEAQYHKWHLDTNAVEYWARHRACVDRAVQSLRPIVRAA